MARNIITRIIAAITPTEMRRVFPETMAGFLVGVSLATFSLCLPYATTRLVLLKGQDVRESLLEEHDVTPADLEVFAKSREEALDWKIIAMSWDDLALVTMRRAVLALKNKAMSQEYVQRAILLQKRALARSPADPYSWMRLAYLSEMAGLRLEAGEALSSSLKADPFATRLFRARFELALRLGDAVDRETKAQLPQMLRVAFKSEPSYVVYGAKEGYYVGVVQEMLASTPEELRRFNHLLNQTE